MLAYEGGFDTFGNQNIAAKRDANLDPQIRIHCRNLINGWHAFGFESFVYFNAGADSYNTQFGQWPLLEDLQSTAFPKNQCMDDVLAAPVPALTAGVAIGTPVAGGAFGGSASPSGTITNASGPFGFPGFAQYLLRVDTAGTYELRFTASTSNLMDPPRVGVQLNGTTINSAFVLPQTAGFTVSAPITLTLRKGINALRLTRPPNANSWTIQSMGFTQTGVAFGLNSVVSLKKHNGTDHEILIAHLVGISGNVTIEPRLIGAGHSIVFKFNAPITQVGSVSSTLGSATSAVSATSANHIVVTLTGVPDNRRAMISLTNVNGVVTPFDAPLGFLVGDMNDSRAINASDISAMKARAGLAATALNFRSDLNADGTVAQTETSAVKARSGSKLPPP